MNVNQVDLETVCGITSTLPENLQEEFAFAGKSNVGKSSLINVLMNRKSFARTSSQPGKTQTINFYHINNLLYFVDLPGYGYAKVSAETKQKWGKMIERYLRSSKQLRIIFLLIDIRHEPSENDRDMYAWIVHNGFEPVIIATKLDKINRSQRDKHIKMVRQGLKAKAETKVIPFSSLSKEGRDEVWANILEVLDEKNKQIERLEQSIQETNEE
jgi:GTP-binding protein